MQHEKEIGLPLSHLQNPYKIRNIIFITELLQKCSRSRSTTKCHCEEQSDEAISKIEWDCFTITRNDRSLISKIGKLLFIVLFISTCSYSAFEDLSPLECKTELVPHLCISAGVLPSTPKIELTYVQSFGMLHYARFSCLWKGLMFGCSTFGGEVYRENEFLLGYCGKKGLSQRDFYYGIYAKVMNLVIKDYGNSWTIGLSGGIRIPIEQTLISIALINFNNPGIGEEEITRRILGGITIFPVDNFILNLRLYKEEGYPVEIMADNRITLSEYFELGFGIKTIPDLPDGSQACYTTGVIFHIKNIDFSYLVRTHETLGLTHIISLGYSLR